MAKKLLTALDLNQNELRNAVIQNLGAAPSSPVNGQIYYLTTGSHDVQARVNGTWTSLLPASLLGATNTWTGVNTFNNTINGSGTLALTGAGGSSVGGAFTATAHVASGLTGATAASRYVGATASGAPTSGTFAVGDYAVAQNGHIWVCTAGGTPGTWVDAGSAGSLALGSTVTSETAYGQASNAGTGTTASKVDHTHGTPTHVGTDHATISLSSLSAPTGDLSIGSHKLTNLTDPTNAQDAATKNYVDNAVAGLAWKDAVQVATTAALATNTYSNGASGVGATLTATANGALGAIDGYTPVVNDRILVKNEATAANNGIYVVTQVGSGAAPYVLTRATDVDAPAELQGATAYVQNGTANGGLAWTMNQTSAITVGTTALNWTIQSGANSVTAGAGLVSSGNIYSVGAGTGIVVNADNVAVDTSVVARKYTTTIGNGSLTSITVTHNLGNQWVNCQIFNASSPFDEEWCDIQLTDANNVTLLFTTAPATNALRVVITG
jgi:hypothetical protein